MEALVVLVLTAIVLVLLDALALRFGVDSTEVIGDDRVRPYAH